MLYSCKCLNFIITTTSDGPEPVDPAILNQLSSRARLQKLGLVTYKSITKRIDMLVGLVRQKDWTEFHCRNCSLWMYACRGRDDGSPQHQIAINTMKVTSPEEIDRLKVNPKYSDIYKIVLYYDVGDDLFAVTQEKLLPIANAWLEEQNEIAEARIKRYSDRQYAELEKKKFRARFEHAAIKRVAAVDEQRGAAAEAVFKQVLESMPKPSTSSSQVPQPQGHSPSGDHVLDLDESLLFETRSLSESLQSEGSDDDVIDLPQPRRATEPVAMARSLPIPVPQFMDDLRHDDRHEQSPQTPSDIAANIQALARSVHGNPIFGDLPRPPVTRD